MRARKTRHTRSGVTGQSTSPSTRGARCGCSRIREGGAERMAHPFYTIGHGTRPTGEFVDLLRGVEVTLLADVRNGHASRANPQYNRDVLPHSLEPFGIGYEHMAALGGLRGR